jgi:hypothetical protein
VLCGGQIGRILSITATLGLTPVSGVSPGFVAYDLTI